MAEKLELYRCENCGGLSNLEPQSVVVKVWNTALQDWAWRTMRLCRRCTADALLADASTGHYGSTGVYKSPDGIQWSYTNDGS